jgi:hypothetical protein
VSPDVVFRYAITIERAHNTHLARSVHVHQDGASNLSDVASNSLANALPYRAHCILHEFFAPYQLDLDAVLASHGYAPMRWDTSLHRADAPCPTSYRHWPPSQQRVDSVRSARAAGAQAADEADDGGERPDDGEGGDGELRAELLRARTTRTATAKARRPGRA